METDQIKAIAKQIGFEDSRFVAADDAKGFGRLLDWLDRGYAGSMQYIENRLEAYRHPSGVLPNCRSILMLVSSYHYPAQPAQDVPSGAGRVARYASSGNDYHDTLHKKLKSLIKELRLVWPDSHFRGVVDSAPLLEREFAMQAGLGWIGKNTMLLSRKWGSYFFLSAILSDREFSPDVPFVADHCGTCTACLDACPTQAFVEPRMLDATRCISYHTIESDDLAPAELRPGFGDWIFGCDICQEVCPWNRKAEFATQQHFAPTTDLMQLDLRDILHLSEADFRKQYRKTPLWRTKLSGLQRNALIAVGNQRLPGLQSELEQFLWHELPTLRVAAAWAIAQCNRVSGHEILRKRFEVEADDFVRGEIAQIITDSKADSGN